MVGVLSTIMAAVVPLASVLVGAGVTYWLNIRSRRYNRIEDLFNAAIDATAVADVSWNYGHLAKGGLIEGLTDEEFQALEKQLVLDGFTNYFKRAAEAREAIARVARYEPRVKPYYQNPKFAEQEIREVAAILVEGRTRYIREDKKEVSRLWWPRLRRSQRQFAASRENGDSARQHP
jgi:hypothetical protein